VVELSRSRRGHRRIHAFSFSGSAEHGVAAVDRSGARNRAGRELANKRGHSVEELDGKIYERPRAPVCFSGSTPLINPKIMLRKKICERLEDAGRWFHLNSSGAGLGSPLTHTIYFLCIMKRNQIQRYSSTHPFSFDHIYLQTRAFSNSPTSSLPACLLPLNKLGNLDRPLTYRTSSRDAR